MDKEFANIKLNLYNAQLSIKNLEKIARAENDLASLVEIFRIKKNIEISIDLLEKEGEGI